MLKFIGSGSAFNTKLGNTSAYYKEGDQMFLIDCGSSIFQRIKEANLLEGVKDVHVLVTHTHADHVGSLADLILYTYYSHGEFAKPKVTVYSNYATGVLDILKLNGTLLGEHFLFITLRNTVVTAIKGFTNVAIFDCLRTNHVEELKSYGFTLKINGQNIYYSGDTSELDDDVIEVINKGKIDFAYIDTCKADYEGNVHISLRKLTELIEPEYRNKVWCMHLDEGFSREEAEELGFNVVKNELQ